MLLLSPPTQQQTSEAAIAALPCTSRVSGWLSPLAYGLAHYVVLPGYFGSLQITGQEHVPTTGPVILAPTHRSRWDSLVVPNSAGRRVTGRDVHFMVSANEISGLQGWFIRRLGGFPVDTKHPGPSSFRHSVELLACDQTLVVFPEGDIFRDGTVHSLKSGLARMALHVQKTEQKAVQIVPIAIRYSDPVPHWRSQIQVKIGQPLSTANYAEQPPKAASRDLTTALHDRLSDLSQHLLPVQ
ncbi:MAG: lysophospholipid acyltransferase family protein [Cyanobacteria bacterium P01_H01_bin.121]